MSYMLLILEPHGQRAERGRVDGEVAYAQMLEFAEDLKSRGLMLGNNSLVTDTSAVRVQVRAGKARLLDGPFTEAKEMVGGYFLVDCATREQAVALAAECPAAAWATVEVRELGPCFL
jgi:hypothetical protein